MSKLGKLVRSPRRFFRDAWVNRAGGGQGSAPVAFAHAQFKQGQPESARLSLAMAHAADPGASMLLSRIELFAGNLDAALGEARRALESTPEHHPLRSDAICECADLLRRMGSLAPALDLLLNVPVSARGSRFFKVARLCAQEAASPEWYAEVLNASRYDSIAREVGWQQFQLLLRDLGKTHQALEIAREELSKELAWRRPLRWTERSTGRAHHQEGWSDRAETALLQAGQDLVANGINPFLVSGTLLGCIRENRLLGHDKDIDLGVTEQVSPDQIREVFNCSPRFIVRETVAEHTVYVEHANGTALDVFVHRQRDGRIWHEGSKARWWNTPFDLESRSFLGTTFLVPRDCDRYLVENYGCWQRPQKDFETFVDTPNMEVAHPDQLALYFLNRLKSYARSGKRELFARVQDRYVLLTGDSSFASSTR